MLGKISPTTYRSEALDFIEEACRAGLISLDIATADVQWSRGMRALLGLSPDTAVTFALLEEMIHPEERFALAETTELMARGLPFDRTVRVIRTDGRSRWLSLHYEFVHSVDGAPRKVLIAAADISDAHDKMHIAHMHANRFQTIVMSVAAVVWRADAGGQVVEATGWRQWIGHTETTALGMKWLDVIHPADQPTIRAGWLRAIEKAQPFSLEFRFVRLEGDATWCRLSAAPQVGERGTLLGWSGLIIDVNGQRCEISGREISGAQIRAARALLRWSVRALSSASGVSAAVIRRLENYDGYSKAHRCLSPIRAALESAGIEFVLMGDGPSSLRFRPCGHTNQTPKSRRLSAL